MARAVVPTDTADRRRRPPGRRSRGPARSSSCRPAARRCASASTNPSPVRNTRTAVGRGRTTTARRSCRGTASSGRAGDTAPGSAIPRTASPVPHERSSGGGCGSVPWGWAAGRTTGPGCTPAPGPSGRPGVRVGRTSAGRGSVRRGWTAASAPSAHPAESEPSRGRPRRSCGRGRRRAEQRGDEAALRRRPWRVRAGRASGRIGSGPGRAAITCGR